jgi:SAM-dependent methyltransferase
MDYGSVEELTGRHRIVRDLVKVRADDRVLEVGCSTGYWVNLYLRQRAAFVVGVDIDHEDIRRGLASARRAPNQGAEPSFLVASALSLPFANDTFSLVYCMDVLEHVADPKMAALETSRVVRPGGRLVITVPGKWLFDRLDLHYPEHRHYSLETIRDFFPNFTLLAAHRTGFLWATLWGSYVRGALARACKLVWNERNRALLLKSINLYLGRVADLDCRLNYGIGSALCAVFERPAT